MQAGNSVAQVRRDRARFVAFAFAAADLLVELDPERRIAYASGAAHGLADCTAEQLIGRSISDLFAARDGRLLNRLLEGLAVGARLEPTVLRIVATGRMVVIGACRLPDQADRCFLTFSTAGIPAFQVPDADRDPATGLLAGDDFAKVAEEHLRLATATGREARLSLLHLDGLDDINAGNDAHDQRAADAFLDELGALLRAHSLGADAAGRLDSDKYGLLLGPNEVGSELADQVQALAMDLIPETPIALSHRSIDMAAGNLSDREAVQAVAYIIRGFAEGDAPAPIDNLGEALRTELAETRSRITEFKRIVTDRAFTFVFQPIVDLRTRAVHHFEVLSRFREGQSPFEMITFAENVGIIEDFDLAVCRKAIDQLEVWLSQGLRLKLAVNISGRSLASDSFIVALRHLFSTRPDLRQHILLEITESTEIRDLDRADRVVQNLRGDGHAVCLDDFGAGASAFHYLRAIGVDCVKLDGAYVRRLLSDRRDASILKAMVTLCRDLGVDTIAEMIETEEQAAWLTDLGVDQGQGWLFGKPGERLVAPAGDSNRGLRFVS